MYGGGVDKSKESSLSTSTVMLDLTVDEID